MMSDVSFRELVARIGFTPVHEVFRKKIENVALLVEDEPSAEIRKQEGLHDTETLLGLYQGIPQTARGDGYGVFPTLPDIITLYRLPILKEAEDTDGDVARVIQETIWHEVAHPLGLLEHEVRDREALRDCIEGNENLSQK